MNTTPLGGWVGDGDGGRAAYLTPPQFPLPDTQLRTKACGGWPVPDHQHPARVGTQHSVQAPAPLWSPASSHVHLAQGLGSWGRPGFSLPSPCCCGHLGRQPVGEKFLCLCLSHQINRGPSSLSLPLSLSPPPTAPWLHTALRGACMGSYFPVTRSGVPSFAGGISAGITITPTHK